MPHKIEELFDADPDFIKTAYSSKKHLSAFMKECPDIRAVMAFILIPEAEPYPFHTSIQYPLGLTIAEKREYLKKAVTYLYAVFPKLVQLVEDSDDSMFEETRMN